MITLCSKKIDKDLDAIVCVLKDSSTNYSHLIITDKTKTTKQIVQEFLEYENTQGVYSKNPKDHLQTIGVQSMMSNKLNLNTTVFGLGTGGCLSVLDKAPVIVELSQEVIDIFKRMNPANSTPKIIKDSFSKYIRKINYQQDSVALVDVFIEDRVQFITDDIEVALSKYDYVIINIPAESELIIDTIKQLKYNVKIYEMQDRTKFYYCPDNIIIVASKNVIPNNIISKKEAICGYTNSQ